MTVNGRIKDVGVDRLKPPSLADICSAKGHVRFAPNGDHESGFPQNVTSALSCGALRCRTSSGTARFS